MNELPSTEHYEICVIEDPEHVGVEIYGIRNKLTGVHEYFDNLLPRAYEALQHTESKYVEMLNIIARIKKIRIIFPSSL